MMAKKKKTIFDDALDIGKSSIITGVMGTAVTQAGGDASGLNALSGYYPVIGNIKGAGYTLRGLEDLLPKKKRRK